MHSPSPLKHREDQSRFLGQANIEKKLLASWVEIVQKVDKARTEILLLLQPCSWTHYQSEGCQVQHVR